MLGLEAIDYWLTKYPTLINQRFSKLFIKEGLKVILENNNFLFNDRFYNQTKETAMGTKVAPTYANLVMGYLERNLFHQIKITYDEHFVSIFKTFWKRYLDDCFLFWIKSINEIHSFHSILNNLHPDIKFTIDISNCKLPFLDILVIKKQTHIITDIYYKSTDSRQYLSFKSCHNKHTQINIPYTLAKRICTIVSDHELKLKRLLHIILKIKKFSVY